MSIRDALASKRPSIPLDVGIGSTVYIKSMTGKDRSIYLKKMKEMEAAGHDNMELSALIVALCLLSENSDPVYSVDQIDEILEIDGQVLDQIVKKALIINGLAGDDSEKK